MELPDNLGVYADDVFMHPRVRSFLNNIRKKMEHKEDEEDKDNSLREDKKMTLVEEYLEALQEEKWIQKAVKKPGALHKALGVPEDEKIPAKKLKVKSTDSPKMVKRKNLAKTLKKLHNEGYTLEDIISILKEDIDYSKLSSSAKEALKQATVRGPSAVAKVRAMIIKGLLR